jgi:hypothetical protein
MPQSPPQRSGWPLLFAALIAGVTAMGVLSLFWGGLGFFWRGMVLLGIVAVLVGLNWLILTLLDRWMGK